jgi:hypothetical protein
MSKSTSNEYTLVSPYAEKYYFGDFMNQNEKDKLKEIKQLLILSSITKFPNICLNCMKEVYYYENRKKGSIKYCWNNKHIVLNYYEYEQDDIIGALKMIEFLEQNMRDKK